MQRAPRPRSEPLIHRKLLLRAFGWLGMIESALCFAGFGAVYWLAGALPVPAGMERPDWLPAINLSGAALYLLATTVFHVGVVAAQVGNAFACRTESERVTRLAWLTNGWLFLAVGLEIVFIGLLVYVPVLARLFDHAPVPFWILPLFAAYAVVLYGLEWLRKLSVRTRAARSAAT
jgi:Ca2+-transporting ATPase